MSYRMSGSTYSTCVDKTSYFVVTIYKKIAHGKSEEPSIDCYLLRSRGMTLAVCYLSCRILKSVMLSADRPRHNPSNSSWAFLKISTVLFPFEQLLGNSVIRQASDVLCPFRMYFRIPLPSSVWSCVIFASSWSSDHKCA